MAADEKTNVLMIRFPYTLHRRLKFKSVEVEKPMAEIVRDLVSKYLDGEDEQTTIPAPPAKPEKPREEKAPVTDTTLPLFPDMEDSETLSEGMDKAKMQKACDDLISSMWDEGKRGSDIAAELNARGLTTSRGNKWGESGVRSRRNTIKKAQGK